MVHKDDPARWHRKFLRYSHSKLDKMFKFTVVRNPWDRTVSAFEHLKKTREGQSIGIQDWSFQRFLRDILVDIGPHFNRHLWTQDKNAYCGDVRFVDFVARFEQLDQDWKVINKAVKGGVEQLPKKNVTKNRKSYPEYYLSDEDVQIVADIYARDIVLFDYKFEG